MLILWGCILDSCSRKCCFFFYVLYTHTYMYIGIVYIPTNIYMDTNKSFIRSIKIWLNEPILMVIYMTIKMGSFSLIFIDLIKLLFVSIVCVCVHIYIYIYIDIYMRLIGMHNEKTWFLRIVKSYLFLQMNTSYIGPMGPGFIYI